MLEMYCRNEPFTTMKSGQITYPGTTDYVDLVVPNKTRCGSLDPVDLKEENKCFCSSRDDEGASTYDHADSWKIWGENVNIPLL